MGGGGSRSEGIPQKTNQDQFQTSRPGQRCHVQAGEDDLAKSANSISVSDPRASFLQHSLPHPLPPYSFPPSPTPTLSRPSPPHPSGQVGSDLLRRSRVTAGELYVSGGEGPRHLYGPPRPYFLAPRAGSMGPRGSARFRTVWGGQFMEGATKREPTWKR